MKTRILVQMAENEPVYWVNIFKFYGKMVLSRGKNIDRFD